MSELLSANIYNNCCSLSSSSKREAFSAMSSQVKLVKCLLENKRKKIIVLNAAAKSLAEPKTHKLSNHGVKPRSARAMIIGIPNVGKSSLINRLAGVNHTKIENRPGVTRAKQWIKIDNGLDLLDTPGILWPKFEDPEVAMKLSWTYAISDEIHDLEVVVCKLLETLAANYGQSLAERFKLTLPLPENGHELLEIIGRKRGCIRKGGIVDLEKAQRLVLNEFRSGKLGRITLDRNMLKK